MGLPDVAAVGAQDRGDALFTIASVASSAQMPAGTVALPGLDPDATYHVRPQAPGGAARSGWPTPWWGPDGIRATGRVLDKVGVRAPHLAPEELVLVRATRVA